MQFETKVIVGINNRAVPVQTLLHSKGSLVRSYTRQLWLVTPELASVVALKNGLCQILSTVTIIYVALWFSHGFFLRLLAIWHTVDREIFIVNIFCRCFLFVQ